MLSKTLSVLLFLFCADFSYGRTHLPHFRADYTYIETFGSYYKFHSTRKPWRDAKRMCSEEGASLFYPETAAEANDVLSFWKRARNDTQLGTTGAWYNNWVYVGMSDIVTEGVYETIDGKSISEVYKNWKTNQPDNANHAEDCVHMNGEGRLNDISCDDEFSFICKKNLQSLDRTDSCTTHQSNLDGQTNQPHFRVDYTYIKTYYTYIKTFGSYYKFHSRRKQWRDAKRTCSEEGASLFYPETAAEANDVISFWKRARNDAQHGTTGAWYNNWVFVGMSDIVTEGVYETIDGKSISEVYKNWNIHQPDNANNAEDCVHMNGEGRLNDISCDYEFSFICKKNLQSLDRTDSCTTQRSNLDGQTNKPHFRADYTYKEKFASYYKFHSTPKEWRDAKRVCSEEGASLFYPENKDEANAVISFWKQAKNDTHPGTTWVYVGISDIITEGIYETIDGFRISKVYNNWNEDQPDDFYGYEDCVHMNEDGRLNDIPCLSKFSFICKKSFLPPVPTNNCQQAKLDQHETQNQDGKDYSCIESFGSYKFHSNPKPWRDAKQMCFEEGASLFYPETANEAKAVISFWNQAKKDALPGIWYSDWFYVGMSDIIIEGLYETIDGKSISEVYNNWNTPQPDNYNDVEDCVHMNGDGRLNDIPCDTEFTFICKKSNLGQRVKLREHEYDTTTTTIYSGSEENYQ